MMSPPSHYPTSRSFPSYTASHPHAPIERTCRVKLQGRLIIPGHARARSLRQEIPQIMNGRHYPSLHRTAQQVVYTHDHVLLLRILPLIFSAAPSALQLLLLLLLVLLPLVCCR